MATNVWKRSVRESKLISTEYKNHDDQFGEKDREHFLVFGAQTAMKVA